MLRPHDKKKRAQKIRRRRCSKSLKHAVTDGASKMLESSRIGLIPAVSFSSRHFYRHQAAHAALACSALFLSYGTRTYTPASSSASSAWSSSGALAQGISAPASVRTDLRMHARRRGSDHAAGRPARAGGWLDADANAMEERGIGDRSH